MAVYLGSRNLISGDGGEEERRWYQKTRTPLFTWSSLAGGFFSGRFTRDNLDTFDATLDRICVETYCYEDNFGRLDRAGVLAREKGLTVPQVALTYVLAQPLEIFALVGCDTGEEFRTNVEAGAVVLTLEEIVWLENGDAGGPSEERRSSA